MNVLDHQYFMQPLCSWWVWEFWFLRLWMEILEQDFKIRYWLQLLPHLLIFSPALGVILLSGKIPNLVLESSIPFYYYLGCFFVVFYLLGMTWIGHKFGVGNAVTFVPLGQITSMAIFDHLSLLSAAYHPISSQRFVGIALMAIGFLIPVRG